MLALLEPFLEELYNFSRNKRRDRTIEKKVLVVDLCLEIDRAPGSYTQVSETIMRCKLL